MTTTETIPQEIEIVFNFLNIDYSEVRYQAPFFGSQESWRPDSIYDSGDFKVNGNEVTQTTAYFDNNENKHINVKTFVVDGDIVKEKILTTFDNQNFLVESTMEVDVNKLDSLAHQYDMYVGAREGDYQEGVNMNERIINTMKELGVNNFTIKNYTPMFSSVSNDWRLI